MTRGSEQALQLHDLRLVLDETLPQGFNVVLVRLHLGGRGRRLREVPAALGIVVVYLRVFA